MPKKVDFCGIRIKDVVMLFIGVATVASISVAYASDAAYLDELSSKYIKEYGGTTVIADDGQAGAFWTLNAYNAIHSNDTTFKKYGSDSYKVVMRNSDFNSNHDYSSNQDLTTYDSFSMWVYGANSGKSYDLRFYNEVFTSRTNGYSFRLIDNFTGWKRFSFSRTSPTSSIGTPIGWDKIRSVTLSTWSYGDATLYFDGLMYHVGQPESIKFLSTIDLQENAITNAENFFIAPLKSINFKTPQGNLVMDLWSGGVINDVGAIGVFADMDFQGSAREASPQNPLMNSSSLYFVASTTIQMLEDGLTESGMRC